MWAVSCFAQAASNLSHHEICNKNTCFSHDVFLSTCSKYCQGEMANGPAHNLNHLTGLLATLLQECGKHRVPNAK